MDQVPHEPRQTAATASSLEHEVAELVARLETGMVAARAASQASAVARAGGVHRNLVGRRISPATQLGTLLRFARGLDGAVAADADADGAPDLDGAERPIDLAARALAYGHLWHLLTTDTAVIDARKLLGRGLTKSLRRDGIDAAKRAGATIRMYDVPDQW
ncbi:MAG: hypothetical protein AAFX81_16075 [Pseudomonadota bacterium]